MRISYEIETKLASRRVGRLLRVAQDPMPAMMAGGRAVVDAMKVHWNEKDRAEPNVWVRRGEGSRRTHFWQKIAEATRLRSVQQGVIEITNRDRRLNQKRYGGPIVPKRAKYLTIPVHATAYARRARRLELLLGRELEVRRFNGQLYLGAESDGGGWTSYYLLRKDVNQLPWPNTMPPTARLKRVFGRAVRQWFREN